MSGTDPAAALEVFAVAITGAREGAEAEEPFLQGTFCHLQPEHPSMLDHSAASATTVTVSAGRLAARLNPRLAVALLDLPFALISSGVLDSALFLADAVLSLRVNATIRAVSIEWNDDRTITLFETTATGATVRLSKRGDDIDLDLVRLTAWGVGSVYQPSVFISLLRVLFFCSPHRPLSLCRRWPTLRCWTLPTHPAVTRVLLGQTPWGLGMDRPSAPPLSSRLTLTPSPWRRVISTVFSCSSLIFFPWALSCVIALQYIRMDTRLNYLREWMRNLFFFAPAFSCDCRVFPAP